MSNTCTHAFYVFCYAVSHLILSMLTEEHNVNGKRAEKAGVCEENKTTQALRSTRLSRSFMRFMIPAFCSYLLPDLIK